MKRFLRSCVAALLLASPIVAQAPAHAPQSLRLDPQRLKRVDRLALFALDDRFERHQPRAMAERGNLGRRRWRTRAQRTDMGR